MSETPLLPFELNDESLAEWLESIRNDPPVNSGSQLNQAINLLRKADQENHLIFPLLMKLTPSILHLANVLANLLKPGAQKKKTAKIAKLCLQLPRNLALAFHSLLDTDQLTSPQKMLASYFALQLTGHYLRLSSLFHELPSRTLWDKSGELFFFAHNNNGLKESIATTIPEFKAQSTLEQVIKRNLLFTLIAFHRQTASDNQALFEFATRYSSLLEFDQVKTGGCEFIWNTKKGAPYPIQAINRPVQSYEIALITSKVLRQIETSAIDDGISPPETERIKLYLSVYESMIHETLPSAPIVLKMLVGIKPIQDFLVSQEKLDRINKISGQSLEKASTIDFTLEPLEFEKNTLSVYAQSNEKAAYKGLSNLVERVKLLQSKNNKYLHLECKDTDCNIGDLILLINNKNATMCGKILRIETVTNTQSVILLLEKVSGILSPQTVHCEHHKNTIAILVNAQSDHPEILLDNDNYRNGTELQTSTRTIRLNALTDYGPSFARYSVSF